MKILQTASPPVPFCTNTQEQSATLIPNRRFDEMTDVMDNRLKPVSTHNGGLSACGHQDEEFIPVSGFELVDWK